MKSKYTFSGNQKLTACLADGDYLWLAFNGVANSCLLYQASIYNPNDRYWDINITADEITNMLYDSTRMFMSLDDSVNIGAVTYKTIATSVYYIKNVGITEKAIDLTKNTTSLYFLTPGIISGTDAKIVKYTIASTVYVETIILTGINNASKIDIDNTGVLWVQSNLDGTPKITKVWYSGTWQFSTTTLS